MADVDITRGGPTGHPTRRGVRNPYIVERTIDWADVLTAKGSGLAAADVIKVLDIPAETLVSWARVEILTAADATTLTLDVGYGSNVDVWTDGADGKTQGYGALGTNGKLYTTANLFTAADTLDIVFATLTGTLTSGKVRVVAQFADVSGVDETA